MNVHKNSLFMPIWLILIRCSQDGRSGDQLASSSWLDGGGGSLENPNPAIPSNSQIWIPTRYTGEPMHCKITLISDWQYFICNWLSSYVTKHVSFKNLYQTEILLTSATTVLVLCIVRRSQSIDLDVWPPRVPGQQLNTLLTPAPTSYLNINMTCHICHMNNTLKHFNMMYQGIDIDTNQVSAYYIYPVLWDWVSAFIWHATMPHLPHATGHDVTWQKSRFWYWFGIAQCTKYWKK